MVLYCQPVVFGTNPAPTGIPNLGCGKKDVLFSASSSTVIQHRLWEQHCYEAAGLWGALGWGLSLATQLCFAPLHTALLAICSSKTSSALQFQLGEHSLQSLVKWESALPKPEESWLIQTEVPNSDSWLVHPHANGDSKFLQFDLPPKKEKMSWLVRMELLWLVCEDADGDILIATQLWLDGESLSPTVWNTVPGTPLQGLAQVAGTQCRQAVSAGFSLKHDVPKRPLCRNGC